MFIAENPQQFKSGEGLPCDDGSQYYVIVGAGDLL
jgi:hypothetical protein